MTYDGGLQRIGGSELDEQFDMQGFLPSSPFLGSLAYTRERRVGLSVYLDDPEVSIDTHHLERALRLIPMGRKNWLFSWTELYLRTLIDTLPLWVWLKDTSDRYLAVNQAIAGPNRLTWMEILLTARFLHLDSA